ncbi:hypothetical protein MMC13_008527 [Lambiella insularis]|nr:hypothetical protein [Lambiella insularis]
MAISKEYELFDIVGQVKVDSSQASEDYGHIYGSLLPDSDVQLTAALRHHNPQLVLTAIPAGNCDLLAYSYAGFASAVLDTDDIPVRWRGFVSPTRRGQPGQLGESTRFAKYQYKWLTENFIVYTAVVRAEGDYPSTVQYVLREPDEGETTTSRSKITDVLIKSVGEWQLSDVKLIYVYDNYWSSSRALWEEVQKARWDDVILDKGMKKTLQDLVKKFFDSKDIYEEAGVPWKRGVIFHGPAGNGKTVSLKAIMHDLSVRRDPVPTLYVKEALYTYHIDQVFRLARQLSPCLLVFEDIDTIVTEKTRSYFLNEVDGLEQNDGIMMIASTNHLEMLDPGLSHRPSRFDRKYLFSLPTLAERTLYCEYWRHKLRNNASIKFPEKLCPAMAGIMEEFTFAYMKEAFVATLLEIAGKRSEDDGDHDEREDLCGHKPDDSRSTTTTAVSVSTNSNRTTMTDLCSMVPTTIEGLTREQTGTFRAALATCVAEAQRKNADIAEENLDDYEIWREMKQQVKILKEDMSSNGPTFFRAPKSSGGQPKEPMDIALWGTEGQGVQAAGGPRYLDELGPRNRAMMGLPDRGREIIRGSTSIASREAIVFVPDIHSATHV